MKVLLIGHSGFIGGNIDSYLRQHHHFPTRIGRRAESDRYIDFSVPSSIHDIEIPQGSLVINAAGFAHVASSSQNYDAGNRVVNFEGPCELAKQAIKADAEVFVHFSTANVYKCGNPSCIGQHNSTCYHEWNAYSKYKYLADKSLLELFSGARTKLVILRLPLVYGPRVPANFSLLVKLANSPLPLPFERFDKKRSVLSVNNLSDFILHLIENSITCTISSGVYDISDAQTTSLSEIIMSLRDSNGRDANLFRMPSFIMSALRRSTFCSKVFDKLDTELMLDVKHLSKQFNWSPPFSMVDEFRNFRYIW